MVVVKHSFHFDTFHSNRFKMHHHKYRRCNCRGNHNNESCPIQPSFTLASIHSKRRDMAKTLAQTLNIFIIIWSIFVWCCKHEYECDEDLYYINQKKTEQKRHIYVCYRHHHHQIQKKLTEVEEEERLNWLIVFVYDDTQDNMCSRNITFHHVNYIYFSLSSISVM